MPSVRDHDLFQPSALERQAIAPHRGDVTTVQAAARVKARAAARVEGFQGQQQPTLASHTSPDDGGARGLAV